MFARSSVHWAFTLGMIYTVVGDTLVNQPPRLESEKGERVIFYCIVPLVRATNAIRVHWWKDDDHNFLDAKKDSRQIFKIPNRASATFTLERLRVSDAGVYYCRVQGEITGNGTGTTLQVSAPPSAPKIFSMGSSDSPIYGCTTTGYYPDDLKMEFFKNDIKLTELKEDKQLTAEGEYNFSSTVEEKEPVPIGTTYSCTVSHPTLKNSPKAVNYTVIPEVRAKRRKSEICVRCSGLKTAKPQSKKEEAGSQVTQKPKTNVNKGTKAKNKAPRTQKHRTRDKDAIVE
ncbi:tyrosine-protein phosphatase non-receptor type substrate 1-like isoform X2 [Callorhinchus milii]|uniref:tyrosine-protein phosphatase non-receptor type substrate 1-like isoform X2 n=1 Tax=Callorhinchus milii TaxID=7868 RepID=UPI001C3FA7CB|nr:tyrosine-protein phosphatase non-receptor type substrate 1-like isoform X2 [Callorhinchus milii]